MYIYIYICVCMCIYIIYSHMHDPSTSRTFALPVAPLLPRAHKKTKCIKCKFLVALCTFNHTPMYKKNRIYIHFSFLSFLVHQCVFCVHRRMIKAKNTLMYEKTQKRKVNVNSIVLFLSFIMCVCIQMRSERH